MEEGTLKYIRLFVQIALVLFIIISFAVVFPIFYKTLNDKDRYPVRAFYPEVEDRYKQRASQMARVSVVSDVLSMTVNSGYATLALYNTVYLPPRYTSDNVTTNTTFALLLGNQYQEFKKLINPFLMNQIAFNGTVNQYPFDKYVLNVTWAVSLPSGDVWDVLEDNKTSLARYPSVEVYLRFPPQYIWDIQTQRMSSDLSSVTVEFSFKRQSLFHLYPVFVFVALWLLTWSVIFYGSRAVIWDLRKLEAPVVGFMGALLVTVPTFRNTSPNAPPFGCLLDFAAFYWAMLAVVITGIAVVIKYANVHDGRAPAPAPAPVPQTESINFGTK